MDNRYKVNFLASFWLCFEITFFRVQPWFMLSMGLLLASISLLLIGPVPFLGIAPSIPLTVFSLILFGAGSASVLVSSYSSSLSSALRLPGYTDNFSTYSYISCLWTASFSLGNFLGPFIAGILYDQVGLLLSHFLLH